MPAISQSPMFPLLSELRASQGSGQQEDGRGLEAETALVKVDAVWMKRWNTTTTRRNIFM